LDYEHQNVNIRRRNDSEHDQLMLNGSILANGHNGIIGDTILFDGQNTEFAQQQQQQQQHQQQQRPTYNLRRAAAADVIAENASATPASSLTNLSIFSRSNSLLPPFGGIELQRSLSTADIEQDVKDVHDGLINREPSERKETYVDNDNSSTKSMIDVRIEEGRLWYQRAWFSRNSPILLVFDDLEIVPALVLTIGRNDLLIRRSGTNIKHRVSLALLHDGHLAIRKRGCIF